MIDRVWRILLWLYPPGHRREYGEEMLGALAYRHERNGGSARAALGSFLDLAAGAAGMWADVIGRTMMGAGQGWLLDAKFVVRSLWKSRGYVATTTAILACAVAANATVLSYARGTLLAEPGWEDPASVMVVWGSNVENGQRRDVVSGPNYVDLRDGVRALDPVAALHHDGTYLLVDGRPEFLEVLEVTVDFLDVLGIEPVLGRDFDERDRMSGGAATVIVTHAFWRDYLEGDPDALGRSLPFEGGPRTIIGVLPEGFEFLAPAPVIVPLREDLLAADERSRIHYNVMGRLVAGATLRDAAVELNDVARSITVEYPDFEGWSFLVEPLQAVSVEAVRPAIVFLTLTVSLVLLVALVNLATLFRIRAMARAGELGVRHALGSGKLRLARVLAIETVGLAVGAATLGLLVTPFLLERVTRMVPAWVPIPDSASSVPVLRATLSPEVAALIFVVAAAGALLLAAPTFAGAGRASLSGSGTRVHGGLRGIRALVGIEVAAATVLCIGAGLTARSAESLLSTDLGVEPEGVLTLYVGDVWGLDAPARTAYFRDVVEAVERVPGVERAGAMGYVDFQAEDDYAGIRLLDRELRQRASVREEWRRVDPGLFETAGMRVVRGRPLEAGDFEGTPAVAVVNEAFAARHYPGRSALGERLSTHDPAYRELEIVGVLRDVRSLGPATPAPPTLYVPYQGNPRGTQGLYVRVSGDPMSRADAIREAIWSVDPSQPVTGIVPLDELVGRWIAVPLATRTLVLALAILTALLSAVGVFGVVAYAVRTRRSEFGVRLALGASPSRLERDLLATVAPAAALSVLAGTILAVVAARGARALLYGVGPLDPLSIGAAVVAMGAAIGLATWLPARRAGRIDPSEAMRVD